MRKPLVSVIMALFNEEQYVKTTIQSILNQTYQNFEIIIVDDYSTDNSVQICKSFNDERIRIYSKTTEKKYAASSRNIAINMAKGEYVLIHDADDWSDPMRIEKQLVKALDKPGRRVVGCTIKRIEDNREYIWEMPEKHDEIVKGFERIFNRTTFVAGTIIAPREILMEIPYRGKFKYFEDWDLLLRLFESGKVEFYNCQEPLYTYFIRKKGVLFKPEWSIYNIFERNCQERRKRGLVEFVSIDEFLQYLKKHPLEQIKWYGLEALIKLRLQIQRRISKNN